MSAIQDSLTPQFSLLQNLQIACSFTVFPVSESESSTAVVSFNGCLSVIDSVLVLCEFENFAVMPENEFVRIFKNFKNFVKFANFYEF